MLRGWWWVGFAPLLSACYVYVPLSTTPEPGVRLAVELNDVGRVGVANNVGPEVGRVEGFLQSRSDSQYVIRVADVFGLYGTRTRWAGEPVTFRSEYLRTVRARRLSRGRTAALVSTLAVALGTFIVTRDLLGLGGGTDVPPPDREPTDQ